MNAIEKATARPWRQHMSERDAIVGPDRKAIALVYSPNGNRADAENDANLSLIVKAVNEHDALNAVAEAADEFWSTAGDVPLGSKAYRDAAQKMQSALEALAALRAKSK